MASNSSALILPAPAPSTNATAELEIRDIKGPVHIPPGWLWFWWTLAVLAAVIVAYFAWRCWRKHRTKPKPPEIIVPPHVRARNRLREALGLIRDPKPFCILVSDTLRVYLEERFDLRAPERTTEEFLEELQSSSVLSLSQKQALGDFLMRCDLVKFARYEPGEPELRDLLDAALRLVDETAPAPLVNAAPGAGVQTPTTRTA